KETLPNGVHPYMTSVASLMGEILFIGIMDPTGKTSPRELRTLADWTLARRFQSIPGVAEVLAMGGGVKQLQIQPRPQAMLARGISFNELHDAAAMAVSNTTGGFLTENAQEIMVRNLAMTIDPDTIGQTIVAHKDGLPVCIADIANVAWGTEPMRGDAGMGSKHSKATKGGMAKGYPGVILSVTKSPGFDTIRLTREVENAMHKMAKTLPEGVEMLSIYRQADYIQLAIGNLKEALRDGAIMVSIILFLFLLNLRVTLITLTAIPLSVAMTILVFDGFGLSVNSMTLGGIAVAIGMVVDDAIVDVENVFRRLRENAGLAHPRGRIDVIADASAEVRSSIFYATVLIVLVFVPLLGLSGVEGRLFSPIAIATIISMLASFLVSLTVIPVLGSFLLKPNPGKQHGDAAPVRALKHLFTKTWLMLALTQPFIVIGLTLGLLFLAVDQALQMGGNFLPAFREPSAVVATTTAPGTSLKQTTEIAEVAIDQLLKIPEVETAGYRAGRAERGDHVVPVSTVEFEVDFDDKSGRPREAVLDEIRTTMRGIPGTFSAMSGPLADRIGHMLSGVSAKVAIKIFGTDLDELRRLGTEIAEIARKIPGLEEARIEQQAPIPQLRIEINRERALAYGVTPGELNEQLAALIGGESLAKIHEDQKIHDLVLRLPPEWRNEPEYLRDLYIDSRSGQRIPLHYIADIRQASGPNTILRENTRRRFVVSINPTTSNLNAAVEELQREVAGNVTLPEGYTVSFEGEYQAQQDAKQRIFIMSGIVLFVVIMLLYGYFRSSPLVLLVLTNLPISLVGGILLTRWTLDNISIATLVGFIAVSGISARNTIMLLSHYLHLMKHEGESFTRKMVERGTRERLVPILMTALSAGIALIPLVFAANEPGKEILNPVAIVIVGGLISSTLLGLLVTPALFYSFCKKSAEKAVHRLGGSSQ
ncbi:MAG: efflux RND transporter permease subunit, partial [Opitutae bacterium]|nr:efflux RND transporter permease subunit [Opitutae bacterium]